MVSNFLLFCKDLLIKNFHRLLLLNYPLIFEAKVLNKLLRLSQLCLLVCKSFIDFGQIPLVDFH